MSSEQKAYGDMSHEELDEALGDLPKTGNKEEKVDRLLERDAAAAKADSLGEPYGHATAPAGDDVSVGIHREGSFGPDFPPDAAPGDEGHVGIHAKHFVEPFEER